MHAFRFAVQAWSAPSLAAWSGLARRAEELGYGTFVVPDHLIGQLSPFAALGAAAAVTREIRLGCWVFANDFRHPLVLAREAATLDLLSDGRLELGLGAGWRTSDYRQLGMAYDRPGLRIDRMEEALGLLKRLFSGERVTHAGAHYRIGAARLHPRPLQRPHPPIAIGGGGRRILGIAAREADIVGIIPKFSARGWPTFTEVGERAAAAKVRIIRQAAGDRFDRLELSAWIGDVGVVGLRRPLAGALAAVKAAAPPLVGGSPYVLYGTIASLRERLLRRREAIGISYYVVPIGAMEELAPLVEQLRDR